ncbi:MAG: DUF4388 domain-containing protein [Acidobacteriota bacterium]
MSIYGYLGTMPVGELLQWVAFTKKTGTVQVSTDAGRQSIAFSKGELVYTASSEPSLSLGRMLLDAGLISEQAHTEARYFREKYCIGIGKSLLDMNQIRREDLLNCMEKKAERQLHDLLSCDDGFFQFDPGLPPLEFFPLHADVTHAVLRITQRMDELGPM